MVGVGKVVAAVKRPRGRPPQRFTCGRCGVVFVGRKNVRQHRRACRNDPYAFEIAVHNLFKA